MLDDLDLFVSLGSCCVKIDGQEPLANWGKCRGICHTAGGEPPKTCGAEKKQTFQIWQKKTFGFQGFIMFHVKFWISSLAVFVDRQGSLQNLRNFSFFSGQHGKMDKDEKNPQDVWIRCWGEVPTLPPEKSTWLWGYGFHPPFEWMYVQLKIWQIFQLVILVFRGVRCICQFLGLLEKQVLAFWGTKNFGVQKCTEVKPCKKTRMNLGVIWGRTCQVFVNDIMISPLECS